MGIRFGVVSDEAAAAMTKELGELKAKAAADANKKPGFFETTAGAVTIGVVGVAVGVGGGYLLFSDKSETTVAKK